METKRWSENVFAWAPFSSAEIVSGYTSRSFRQEDAKGLAKIWKNYFPELQMGAFSVLTDPERYPNDNESTLTFVIEKEDTKQLVGAFFLMANPLNLSVDFTLAVVDENHRKHGILREMLRFLLGYVERSGGELVTLEAAVFHTATQKVANELRFQSYGIRPGAIRAFVGNDDAGNPMYRRDPVRCYYKLLNGADKLIPAILII